MAQSDDTCQLSAEEERLLEKHLNFYRALETGTRKPTTPAQEHFVLMTLGRAGADTAHEKAYAKHMRLRAERREARRNENSHDPAEEPRSEWFTREGWYKLRFGYRHDAD